MTGRLTFQAALADQEHAGARGLDHPIGPLAHPGGHFLLANRLRVLDHAQAPPKPPEFTPDAGEGVPIAESSGDVASSTLAFATVELLRFENLRSSRTRMLAGAVLNRSERKKTEISRRRARRLSAGGLLRRRHGDGGQGGRRVHRHPLRALSQQGQAVRDGRPRRPGTHGRAGARERRDQGRRPRPPDQPGPGLCGAHGPPRDPGDVPDGGRRTPPASGP